MECSQYLSTAGLLLILSQVYSPGLIFTALLALDIGCHWLQMYSTFLLGKSSHKDVKDSTSWLFRAYYRYRMLMGFCCAFCEVLYVLLFLVAEDQIESLPAVLGNVVRELGKSRDSGAGRIGMGDQEISESDSDEGCSGCLCAS